ncbi:MAG: hypothetical protein KGJ60_03695 [Verrucomicrobiota bacterium]|nr:hypothetical protein [Verrucomicrobiota bacterium]
MSRKNKLPAGGARGEEGVIPHLIAQRFSEHLQIKAVNVLPAQPSLHCPGVTHIGERSGNDDAIPTAHCANDLVGVALGQQLLLGNIG